MGRFTCTECSEPTSVIETRLSSSRIRRRRACPKGHRFNTLEMPIDICDQLHDLIKWFKPHIDDDAYDYAHSRVDEILSGVPEEPDEPAD